MASTPVFHVSGKGAEGMAREMGVPFLGRVPMDPSLSQAAEEGRSCFGFKQGETYASPSAIALQKIIDKVLGVIDATNGV